MQNEENYGEEMEMCGCSHEMCMCGYKGEYKKEFKMAYLKKKEKMLEAKLEFIREMKEIMEKMPKEER